MAVRCGWRPSTESRFSAKISRLAVAKGRAERPRPISFPVLECSGAERRTERPKVRGIGGRGKTRRAPTWLAERDPTPAILSRPAGISARTNAQKEPYIRRRCEPGGGGEGRFQSVSSSTGAEPRCTGMRELCAIWGGAAGGEGAVKLKATSLGGAAAWRRGRDCATGARVLVRSVSVIWGRGAGSRACLRGERAWIVNRMPTQRLSPMASAFSARPRRCPVTAPKVNGETFSATPARPSAGRRYSASSLPARPTSRQCWKSTCAG